MADEQEADGYIVRKRTDLMGSVTHEPGEIVDVSHLEPADLARYVELGILESPDPAAKEAAKEAERERRNEARRAARAAAKAAEAAREQAEAQAAQDAAFAAERARLDALEKGGR